MDESTKTRKTTTMKKILITINIFLLLTFISGCDLLANKITEQELQQGWYEAGKDGKKEGTPSNWVWVNSDGSSKWMQPVTEMLDY